MNCEFSDPIEIGEMDFEYSKMSCTPVLTELIQNGETGAEFYVRKEVSYGDILLLTFLTLFLIFGVVKFLTDFLIPRLVNFKRK